ncbi:MAG TPA: M43 family zinc metalloprotease [Flavobacteriales bacterium]|nr:M43 family zinc metalloprotease [Flavobacteriales bacterium]
MRHAFFLTLLCSSMVSPLMAQQPADGFTCKTNDPDMVERIFGDNPGAREHALWAKAHASERAALFAQNHERGGGGPFIIPVVFHIIHNNGPENITDAQVYDAVRVLNDDYNKLNPDWVNVQPAFLDLVADVGIEFRLANLDPDGNCTNGITRTVSELTYQGDYETTQLIHWPRERYMNVWVCAVANGAAGYTNYPWVLDGNPDADGIVLLSNYCGSIGTSSPYHSRVLSHEVGHWLNLMHCWGNSNDPGLPENCGMDDEVEDTPNTVGWTSCLLAGASCGSEQDNVENYMEYSYCDKMFTWGQADRMLSALVDFLAQRNELWQPENLAQTGVLDQPVLCLAQFSSTQQEICTGASTQFFDQSYNGVTSRTWAFPGGEPAASSEQNPVVTYAVPGTYPVTLTVSDGVNTLSTTSENLITVLADPGAAVPVMEGFENIVSLPVVEWGVSNPNGDNTFEITNATAFTGGKCVRLLNTPTMDGRFDELVSYTYDMSAASDITIAFRYAYARRNADDDDILRFSVSNNCGATWSLRKILRGSNSLTTGGTVTGNFVPTGLDQWGYSLVDNISSGYHAANFRIKFEFESDGGNNLYIDDININGMPVGLQEVLDAGTLQMLVVPNPVQDEAGVMFQMDTPGQVRMDLLDVVGRSVRTIHNGMLSDGIQRIALPVAGLPSGMYMVRLTRDGASAIARFTMQ